MLRSALKDERWVLIFIPSKTPKLFCFGVGWFCALLVFAKVKFLRVTGFPSKGRFADSKLTRSEFKLWISLNVLALGKADFLILNVGLSFFLGLYRASMLSAPRYDLNEVISSSIFFFDGSFPTKLRVKKIVRRDGAGGMVGWDGIFLWGEWGEFSLLFLGLVELSVVLVVVGEATAEFRASAKDLSVELSDSSILMGEGKSRSGDLSACFLFLSWAGVRRTEVSMLEFLWGKAGVPKLEEFIDVMVDPSGSLEISVLDGAEEVEMAVSFRTVDSSLLTPNELSFGSRLAELSDLDPLLVFSAIV